MRILLVLDEGLNIDLERSINILNTVCNTVSFDSCKDVVNTGSRSSYVDLEKEIDVLNRRLIDSKRDYTIYVTLRRFEDNWFFHSTRNTMILSFFGWEHYTNLPLENGLFYFITDALALRIVRGFRHEKTTGCIYDFLWDKTGVDIGMKMAYICDKCLRRVENRARSTPVFSNILFDLMKILDILSSASKWGKSVLDIHPEEKRIGLDWLTFEDQVAQLYRELGGNVKQNVNLSGFQIDVYVEEETPSKQKIRLAVECKFYGRKIGNRIVNDFARIVKTLEESKIIDKGVIVSHSGFSNDAFSVSKTTGIELLRFEDLKQRAGIRVPGVKYPRTTEMIVKEKEQQIAEKKERSPSVFVIMPFSKDLDDVYYFGILETARALNCTCERADQIEYVGIVLEKIYDMISNSRIIIAEVSSQNPNVYYEVGYAHALNKPVIFITKDMSTAPFDLRGFNHVIYNNIRELRPKLKRRLEAILGPHSD